VKGSIITGTYVIDFVKGSIVKVINVIDFLKGSIVTDINVIDFVKGGIELCNLHATDLNTVIPRGLAENTSFTPL
jgi:hypothetical protein